MPQSRRTPTPEEARAFFEALQPLMMDADTPFESVVVIASQRDPDHPGDDQKWVMGLFGFMRGDDGFPLPLEVDDALNIVWHQLRGLAMLREVENDGRLN